MKGSNKNKLFLLAGVLAAASLACSLLPGSDGEDGQTEINAPADGSGEESGEAEEPQAAGSGNDAACVVGTWAVDNASMAEYLSANLNQGDDNFFTVNEVSGALVMDLGADGLMGLSSDAFTVSVGFDPGVADLVMDMTFVYEANGTAQYAADDGTLRSWDQDWNVEETSLAFNPSITADGSTYTLSISPGIFMQQEGEDSTANYECSGDMLTIFVSDAGEVTFNRQ